MEIGVAAGLAAVHLFTNLLSMGGVSSREMNDAVNRTRDEMQAKIDSLDDRRRQETFELRGQVDRVSKQLRDAQADLTASQESLRRLELEMNRVRHMVERKVAELNALELAVKFVNKVAFVGVKGSFKSTAAWLMGKGPKPQRAVQDGTTSLVYHADYIDTIGLRWDLIYVVKLHVLFMVHGFPSDMAVFCSDRVGEPMQALVPLLLVKPMSISISSNFWRDTESHMVLNEDGEVVHEPPRMALTSTDAKDFDRGVKVPAPPNKLMDMYDGAARLAAHESGAFEVVTHLNIEEVAERRKKQGRATYETWKRAIMPGGRLTISTNPSGIEDMVFRFMYIYKAKYEAMSNGDLEFINNATVQEFADVELAERQLPHRNPHETASQS
ncbi:hypothetical protein DFJ73DRAFT_808965 [Zopfochytrium polystomum]|nr:hypothetical protein DFJ73DRAFT_808965 [Zopfochytrium polystomum]